MASTQLYLRTQGQVLLNLEVKGRTYENIVLEVMPRACVDVILGQKSLSKHEAVVFELVESKTRWLIILRRQKKNCV